ncbi:proton glutamate symport protein [Parabacteroides sp. PF5-5]|uniref:dicarboxylate/amino acid:cation symporter n=1 Tax=unclassified Parabacteroides TaxID=2649774 RepID=UPI0024730841|nr:MULTISPECIES: dicarboxylate/amino acid:cation symporter [unclassified Parabacteroides]MDH6305864.1 proton glutamate symport protein [Parabacteroides sp. PH5-39]MDH6317322.1 proton glutamate symport protein [Parabacteroides sp. PF5-13]MDH6320530.1 proton glutamate symport protein [Parabacteroides sp. PH5-13]MDH6324307.1 proton glutamate symport protein [Parabacteroides sp. PH5-8]MDH6328504.1 proton glutamate symport protein [Parabacteroides sp. PH5-41]
MIKRKLSAIPLYLQILLGMIVGIIIGLIALFINGERFIQDWIRPWGQLFIRLLQLIAIPLVFISLVNGVSGLKDISKFSKMGGKTILIYIFTTAFAVLLGLGLGLAVKPGELVDQSQIVHIQEDYYSIAEQKKQEAAETQKQGPLAFLNDIVPNNIVGAAADNSKMLQVIFFAIFFGIASLTIPPEKVKPVLSLFNGLNEIILRMIDYIIRFAPLGVAALMAGLIIDFKGDASVFGALAVYALTVVVALFSLIFFFYPALIHIFTQTRVKKFLKAMYPVQLFAFTTSSSAATLPVTMETVEKELGVAKDTASFVLPVGTTINMDGTSCYQAIAVLFIAQVLGIELGLIQLLTILLMTILSSIGTPAIPGGSYVILTMVLTSVGIPAEGLALILGIDRPLDMLRTAVNVTGDATVAIIIDKK